MAKFFVGQRVRVKWVLTAKNASLVGAETHIVTAIPLIRWTDGYEGSGYVLHCKKEERKFDPSKNKILCEGIWRESQLEPILPEGAAPSEFTTLADLLASLEVTA